MEAATKQHDQRASDNSEDESQGKPGHKKNRFEREQEKIDPAIREKWNREQQYIRTLIKETDEFDWNLDPKSEKCVKYIGGVDISFSQQFPDIAVSYIVVVSYPNLQVVYQDHEIVKLDMAYVAGFLAFREAQHIIKLHQRLVATKPEFAPQVILTDGNGILHQNACGLASHLGVLLNTPTVGVGKKVFLVDGVTKDIVHERFRNGVQRGGDYVELKGNSGRIWGAALKSCDKNKDPIIVSIGHNISLRTACTLVHAVCRHRVPEPVRQADLLSRKIAGKMQQADADNAVTTNKLQFLTESLP